MERFNPFLCQTQNKYEMQMNRKNTKAVLLLIVTASIVSIGCKKNSDKPADPSPVPVINKLAKLEYSDGSYDSLFYNGDGNVTKIKQHSVFPGSYDEIFSFTYDNNKKVSRITDNHDAYYDYKYSGNDLISVAHYVRGQKEDFKFYDYANGKLSTVEEYYQEMPGTTGWLFTSERRYSYYADGNVKQEIQYTFDAQRKLLKDVTIDYSDYDGKVNSLEPLGHFLYLSQVSLAKNNVRKYTTKHEATGISSEFSFEYTYNDFSNPLTHKMTYKEGNNTHTEMVKYYYY